MTRLLTHAVCAGVTLAAACSITVSADPLPAKDGSSFFTYQLDYAAGTLYLLTGDTLYETDLSTPANPTFSPMITGINAAAGNPIEGSLALNDSGLGIATVGFNGGAAYLDIDAGTAAGIPPLAAANTGSAATPTTGGTYLVDATTNPTQLAYVTESGGSFTVDNVVDYDPGFFSSAITGDGDGGLIVSSFDFVSQQGRFFAINASDLAAFETGGTTPSVTPLGNVDLNGSSNLVVTTSGDVYVASSTGVGLLNFDTDTVATIYGDFTSDPFDIPFSELPVNGLAYDPTSNQLAFARYDSGSGQYQLELIAIPEPMSLALFGAAGVLLVRRKVARRVG